MKIIEEKIKNLQSFQKEAFAVVIEVVRDNEDLVLKLNTNDQLFDSGVDSMGKKIEPKYTASTVATKRSKGQPTGRVTLRDKGDFHASFFVLYEDDRFTIFSDDPKAKYLFDKYGDDVLGLNKESVEALRDKIRGAVLEKFRKSVT